MNTELALAMTYVHLPEKLNFLSYPPKDITKDKYNDTTYLSRVIEMVEELKEKDFVTREDGVGPYSKEVIIKHFQNRIKELSEEQK